MLSVKPIIWNFILILLFFSICIFPASANTFERVKRQASTEEPKKEESFEKELCKDKDAGEWFRLVAGEGDNCRDVIQCTSSVSKCVKSVKFFTRWRKINVKM